MKDEIIFETERTVVRMFVMKDVDDALGWMADATVVEFDEWETMSREEVVDFIKEQRAIPKNATDALNEYAIELRSEGKVIGGLSFHLDDGKPGWASFGYHFNPAYQRKGFGQEIAIALMNHIFSLGAKTAFAKVDPRNTGSCLLLEKIGFQLKEVLKNSCIVHGHPADENVYLLQRENWKLGTLKNE